MASLEVPMAGLEPARANYGPTDFKSVASTIPPHRLFSLTRVELVTGLNANWELLLSATIL